MQELIQIIRAEVRGEKPYLVGAVESEHCKLNQNECPYDLPAELKRTLLDAFEQIPFNRYPTEQPFQLMQRLEAEYNLPEGSVLVGNGSNDLTQTLGLCFISPGTRVVLPSPMFALFASVSRMYGANVQSIASGPDLRFDMDGIIEAASQTDVSLTIVASPNNPTGLAVPFAKLERLCDRASGFVVIDEAYQEFNSEPSVVEILKSFPNLLVMRTLSKAFGLAGMRIGYLLGQPDVIGQILKARLPFMIDRLAETTALLVLDRPDLVSERIRLLQSGLRWLCSEMRELHGVSVLPTTTNFVLFKTHRNPTDVLTKLARDGVIVRSMAGYPELQDYLRVNAGTDAENKAFVKALKRVLEDPD